LELKDCLNTHCPWSGDPVQKDGLVLYRGKVLGFCNPGCRDKWMKAASLFDQAIAASAKT
jgi:hypothetical protein